MSGNKCPQDPIPITFRDMKPSLLLDSLKKIKEEVQPVPVSFNCVKQELSDSQHKQHSGSQLLRHLLDIEENHALQPSPLPVLIPDIKVETQDSKFITTNLLPITKAEQIEAKPSTGPSWKPIFDDINSNYKSIPNNLSEITFLGKQRDLKNIPATCTSLEKEHVAVEDVCGSTVPAISSHTGISDDQHQPDNVSASGAGRKQLCYYCGKESAFRWHLECHEKFSSGETRPFSCHICNTSFTSKEILKCHYNSHLPGNPLDCDLRGKTSLGKTTSILHQKIHYPKEHQCNICFKNYRNQSNLNFHMKYHHTDGIFPGVPCDICSKMLLSNSALNKHRKIHFPENHQCNICFKIFRNKSTLILHQKYHQASEIRRDFLCDICGHLCTSILFLKRHILNVHTPHKKYICDVCGIRNNILTYFIKHMETHNRDKKFICAECNKHFKSKTAIKRHIEQCHRETMGLTKKTFPCQLCGKVYQGNSGMIKHMRYHTGERNFVCDLCGKHFMHPFDLSKHMKSSIHNEELAAQQKSKRLREKKNEIKRRSKKNC